METEFNPRTNQYDFSYLDQKMGELIKQFNDVELSREKRNEIDHLLYLIIKNQKCVDQKLIEKHFDELPWEHRTLSIQSKLPSFNFLLERRDSSLNSIETTFLEAMYKEELFIHDKQRPRNSQKAEAKFNPIVEEYDLNFLDKKIKDNIKKINDKEISFEEKGQLNYELYCIFTFQGSVTIELAEKYFDDLLDSNKTAIICRKQLSLDFLIKKLDSLDYTQLVYFNLYYNEELRNYKKDKSIAQKIKEKAEKLISEIKDAIWKKIR